MLGGPGPSGARGDWLGEFPGQGRAASNRRYGQRGLDLSVFRRTGRCGGSTQSRAMDHRVRPSAATRVPGKRNAMEAEVFRGYLGQRPSGCHESSRPGDAESLKSPHRSCNVGDRRSTDKELRHHHPYTGGHVRPLHPPNPWQRLRRPLRPACHRPARGGRPALQRGADTAGAQGPPGAANLPINSLRTSVSSGSTSIGLRR